MKLKTLSLALALGLGLTVILLVLLAGTPARAGASAGTPFSQEASHLSSLDSTSSASHIIPAAYDPNPPTEPVKLIFIHHSCGEYWLSDGDGGLGIALRDNNYFVSDTNYGWGPGSIGDQTDIGHWWTWFCGPSSTTYLSALYTEYGDHSYNYSRLTDPDPSRENEIIMFKSCFPNSYLGGNPDDPPPTGSNPLRGQDSGSEHHTVANAKGIYNDLLTYFATRQDKLFIVITAPPQVANDTDPTHAANARAFNDWLVNDWLEDYSHNNVAVFDFYNVLTSNGGSTNTNDLDWTDGNHHRWWNGAIQHIQTESNNYSAYGSSPGDSHPTQAGNQKATGEFVSLLNIYYHRWQEPEGPQKTASPITSEHGQTVTYTIVVKGLTAPPTATVHLTDVVPTGLSYVSSTITATSGVFTETAAPTLRWSGYLPPTLAVTVTYAVTVNTTASQFISNSVVIAAPGYQTLTRTAMVLVNGLRTYLPLVLKGSTP